MSAVTEPTQLGPASTIPRARGSRAGIVAADRFAAVRAALVTLYGAVYVYRFFSVGIIVDRVSVAISVLVFLGCAFVGRPWGRWAWLGVEVALYALMWWAYEITRTGANGAHRLFGWSFEFPLVVTAWRDLDRLLFFGHDGSVVLQRHFFDRGDVHWYDNVASALYFSHFIVPVIAMAALWAISQYQWRRFMKRFATLLAVSCLLFVVFPSVPPWMADDRYGAIASIERPSGRGFYDLGLKAFSHRFEIAKGWGNPVAAMPSLHAAFALLVPAFFLPWIRPRWLKALVLTFPVAMLVALVYLGEHWAVDGIAGWLIVGGSFWVWGRVEQRGRTRRAERARRCLGDMPVPRR